MEYIDGEQLFEGKIFDVRKVGMTQPSGKYVQREIVENPEVVCVVPVDDDANVLMIKQMRPVSKTPFLEIPAGRVEEEEFPFDAAQREMQEEIGYFPNNIRKIGYFFTSPGWCTEQVYCYLGLDLEEKKLPEDKDEEIEVVKIPANKIMEKIESGEINDAKTITALLLALPKIKEYFKFKGFKGFQGVKNEIYWGWNISNS